MKSQNGSVWSWAEVSVLGIIFVGMLYVGWKLNVYWYDHPHLTQMEIIKGHLNEVFR